MNIKLCTLHYAYGKHSWVLLNDSCGYCTCGAFAYMPGAEPMLSIAKRLLVKPKVKMLRALIQYFRWLQANMVLAHGAISKTRLGYKREELADIILEVEATLWRKKTKR